jgi:hypothetical protein
MSPGPTSRIAFFLALSLGALPLQATAQAGPPAEDSAFQALQQRGALGMGVDQYASTHVFDALPDGGRIEYQHDGDDAEGIEQIRRHLQEIRTAFAAGDFSTPAFVHARDVPGTDVMAARRDHIEYVYRDLPRGGELRLITEDPQTLAAIRDFMAFQRSDHRADGMDHGAMDHGGMDHGSMGRGGQMGSGQMGPAAMDRHYMEMGGGDPAFAADMQLVHELLANHGAITRTVVHLPNGIRTVTESPHPEVASAIVAHVASMEARLEAGEVFNLFSHTLPAIFEGYDRIDSEFEYTDRGVAVVQTSDDPALVEALQGHAEEVTEMVDEGMAAMMRGMMQRRMEGGSGMPGRGMGRGPGHGPPAP